MRAQRPTTPADHIARAKEFLTGGVDPQYAIANALIAIAELLAAQQVDIDAAELTYCHEPRHTEMILTDGDWPRCAHCGLFREMGAWQGDRR